MICLVFFSHHAWIHWRHTAAFKDQGNVEKIKKMNSFCQFPMLLHSSSAEDAWKITHLLFWSLFCLFIHLLPCISLALVHHTLSPSLAVLPRFIKFESISSTVTSRTTSSTQACVCVCVHVGAPGQGLTCGCNPSLICQCLLSHEKPARRN